MSASELERVSMSVEFSSSEDETEYALVIEFDEPVDDAANVATGWLVGLRHFCDENKVSFQELIAASEMSFSTLPVDSVTLN